MKRLILLITIIISTLSFAQEKGKIVLDEKSHKNMYVGYGDLTVFKDTSFSTWYGAEYDVYQPDKEVIKAFTPEKMAGVKITIVMGTWCSDSKREVPRFIKLLDAVKFDTKNVNLIFVDKKKINPYGDIEPLQIKSVPTLIIYRDDKEIGRIIESPVETLEKDLAGILK